MIRRRVPIDWTQYLSLFSFPPFFLLPIFLSPGRESRFLLWLLALVPLVWPFSLLNWRLPVIVDEPGWRVFCHTLHTAAARLSGELYRWRAINWIIRLPEIFYLSPSDKCLSSIDRTFHPIYIPHTLFCPPGLLSKTIFYFERGSLALMVWWHTCLSEPIRLYGELR